jgi:virginiamycin B lyase
MGELGYFLYTSFLVLSHWGDVVHHLSFMGHSGPRRAEEEGLEMITSSRWAALAVFACSFVLTPQGMAQTTNAGVDIKEWDVPWENSRPRDPYVENNDAVWFVGQVGNYLARLTPSTGKMDRFELDKGTGPHNLIVGHDGMIWYAGNRAAHIGRFNPQTGEIHKIPMPHPDGKDPHTLIFNEDQTQIWFTLQGSDMIGRLIIETEEVNLIKTPTKNSRPYGIAVGPDGTLWVAAFAKPMLLRVDSKTMRINEVNLPRPETRPRRLEVSTDGRVWYVDYRGGKLGMYVPDTGKIREWAMPSGEKARPYGMEIDAEDRLWFVETGVQPNMFAGFDTKSETFLSSTAIPSGAKVVRHMAYHQETKTIWFGTDANTIGRALLK